MADETDLEFVERLETYRPFFNDEDYMRFILLARRGAMIPDAPTEAMCEAGYGRFMKYDGGLLPMGMAYRAMIKAALKETK